MQMRKVNSENGYIGTLLGVEPVFTITILSSEAKFRHGHAEGTAVLISERLFNDISLVMEATFLHNNSHYYLYCSRPSK